MVGEWEIHPQYTRPRFEPRSPRHRQSSIPQSGAATEAVLSRPEPACYNSTLCFCPTGYTYEPLTGTCDLPPGADSHTHGTMGPTGHKPSCNIVNTCHPHAQCVLITQDNKYRCQCDAGYEGDGYECGEIGGCNFWSWVLASDPVRVNQVWTHAHQNCVKDRLQCRDNSHANRDVG
uniref:EGF-like domain-containing protein n=1 Tax=Timema shepardi TaxID=629360 RepID=A0A7R9BCA8_TIMSH|nr:unnamed protein product [Timema shepardi]